MEITQQELTLLNFYRASELHGGLVLGQLVRRVRDPRLILNLTRHGAEEIVHAQLWTETILAVGGRPWPIRDTYQTRYAEVVGTPLTVLDVLALTQVFERRVFRHFTIHRRRSGTHPRVVLTLGRMLDEERGHLAWVKRWLEDQSRAQGDAVRQAMRRYAEADRGIYDALTVEFGWRRAA
jgi:hypothetical protein